MEIKSRKILELKSELYYDDKGELCGSGACLKIKSEQSGKMTTAATDGDLSNINDVLEQLGLKLVRI